MCVNNFAQGCTRQQGKPGFELATCLSPVQRCVASRHLNIPPPLSDIERVTQATLLGFDITSTLSTSVYVDRIRKQINQRLYLLSQLKSQGMKVQALHELFIGLIMSKITCTASLCRPPYSRRQEQDKCHITKGPSPRYHPHCVRHCRNHQQI